MKRVSFVSLILLVCAAFWLTGCKTTQAPSSSTANAAPSASSNANASESSSKTERPRDAASNANTSTQAGASAQATAEPAKLIGTYRAHEVQDKGVVTLMSAINTVIYFSPEGTYSRVSEKEGKVYHRDSGQFRIQAPDKLLLTIQMSDRKIQSPPLERTHTFSLSSDGEELKLTSREGSVAIFRRTAAPKGK